MKISAPNSGGGIAYYNADIVTDNDYYPFGMQMPGRAYAHANSGYRYAFNTLGGNDKTRDFLFD